MNTFTWKSIWRIRHTDEMRSILEVVLNSYDNLKKGKVQIMLSLNETCLLYTSLASLADGGKFSGQKDTHLDAAVEKLYKLYRENPKDDEE